jgi:predicted ABC-type transport system involved in lysophospholipase L1 biosynthesis ATPase subunit
MRESQQPTEGLSPMPTPVLEARDLRKSYPWGRTRLEVLRGVSVCLQAGESVALLGASGSGKSTLLHLLGGLEEPDGGRVWIAGVDLFGLGAEARARLRGQQVGFVFQFHHLLGELSALENVALPLWMGGASRREAFRRARALLERLGLGDRLDHRPSELSGGEQQRVAIARALIRDPVLLLADEPTGNLDARARDEVLELFEELRRERRTALLLATHDVQIASRCERRLLLEEGLLRELPP